MQPVKVVRTDSHSIITGSDRARVEAMIAELLRHGARLIDSIKPLGNNWIATCEDPPGAGTPEVVNCERIGLRTFSRASSRGALDAKLADLLTFGAVVVVPPTCDAGEWIAVIDDRGTRPK